MVDDVKKPQARKPYDAPNWNCVPIAKSPSANKLKTYEQQLQSSGLVPDSINVALSLPPDLYLLRANGIDMRPELSLHHAADQRQLAHGYQPQRPVPAIFQPEQLSGRRIN